MFEQSLVKRQQSRRRGWTLALAVAVHGAALATVVLASSWSIPEVEPPFEQAIFTPPLDVTHLTFEQPQRPATPPPAAPQPPAAPPAPADPAPVQPPAPPETQPTQVPAQTPVGPSTPADGTMVDSGAPPSSGPAGSGGEGDGPVGPSWGNGEGEIAQALDARMTRPETISRVNPRYTEAARIARRQGMVIVQATIDRTGRVTDVRLVKGLGLGLDESAIKAVQQWRFKPAALAGRPVPVYFQLSVNFTIR
jgi:periplasmic protein TonB